MITNKFFKIFIFLFLINFQAKPSHNVHYNFRSFVRAYSRIMNKNILISQNLENFIQVSFPSSIEDLLNKVIKRQSKDEITDTFIYILDINNLELIHFVKEDGNIYGAIVPKI